MKNVFAVILTLIHLVALSQDYNVTSSKDEAVEIQTKERQFILDNFKNQHIVELNPGARFVVVSNKYTSSFEVLNLCPYRKSNCFDSKKPNILDNAWKVITLEKVEERNVSCPKGRCTRTYVVFNINNQLFEYELYDSKDNLIKENYRPKIDNLVSVDNIDKAKSLLIGKTLFINSQLWENESGLKFMKKFYPVTIKNIGATSDIITPIKVIFQSTDGIDYFMKMSDFSALDEYNCFPNLFSFDNPKEKYPEISDSVWEKIQSGKIETGMTKSECILSIGKPTSKNYDVSQDNITEQWVYRYSSSVMFLYFKDDILFSFQM